MNGQADLAHNLYLQYVDSSLDHAGPKRAGNKVVFDGAEEQQELEGKTDQNSTAAMLPLFLV